MTEKELIDKIQQLRQIEPDEGWVLATKSQILGEPSPSFSFQALISSLFVQRRLAFASLLVFLVLVGTFGFAQNSLPGDFLYPLKKMTERSQQVFISGERRPKAQLELANKRLEELTRIAKDNKVKKLASALEEFEASKIEVEKEVVNSIKDKSEEEAIKIVKELAPELKAINEKEKEVFASLGIELKEEEAAEGSERTVVEILIKDLEGRTLSKEQEEVLAQVKEAFEKGDYSQALEKILLRLNLED